MSGVTLLVFHREPLHDDPPLTARLQRVRGALLASQMLLFRACGVEDVQVVERRGAATFGDELATLVTERRLERLIMLGSGAVARLRPGDARRLVATAASARREALTNNRYSSDVLALSVAGVLRGLPPVPADNVLPRWLAQATDVEVAELPGRDRLALDLDSPLDAAVLCLAPDAQRTVRAAAGDLAVPRLGELRALVADRRRELLVFGRSSARMLGWLERHASCRVRFLAEERGLRASSPLGDGGSPDAAGAPAPTKQRPPRATLGRLLGVHGPGGLAGLVAELADGAIVDTRVLLADRLGADESAWPAAEDRYASDLHLVDAIVDPWLHDLTASAAGAGIPILLGGHTLVGPGLPLVCGTARVR